MLSFGLFIAVTVALIAVNGLFLSRDLLFLWVLVGLLALSVSDLKRWVRGLIFDWLPFAAWLVLYDLSRFFSEKLGTVPHVAPQINADRFLFGDPVPTVRLQAALNTAGQVAWFDYIVWGVYMTHYFATLLIAAVLWRFAYQRFREFRRMVLTLATFGFITYVAFPAVPPWMAAMQHHLEPVRRIVNVDVWNDLGIQVANSLVENGSGFFNQVAAVPSLHAAYPLLFLLFFWAGAHWYWRVLLVAYPLAMSFTLVYSGEHYVFDILLGWVYAVMAFALVRAWDRWRAARRVKKEPVQPPGAISPAPAPASLTAAVERE
ncbi:MAG TPA: phosphatase PAP2 family protein [Solirubrobacteraceae bacterium]|nr:phosphatase PAP2 family protein [Solirubrobacteraceae bacterium]